MRHKVVWLGMMAMLMLVVGCASQQATLTPINSYRAADFTMPYEAQNVASSIQGASLWPGDVARNLVTDHRATRVNDIVTIQIVEDAQAKGTAQTKTARSSGIGMGVSGLFGFEQSIARQNPNMNLDTLVGARTENSFDGSGETARTTKVVAEMGCTVVEVFPNGNLRIRGKRMIQVNGEDQVITLSGIIRPEDIDNENTVQSTRIADARITYLGLGVLADKQKPGWMTRVLDNVWPF